MKFAPAHLALLLALAACGSGEAGTPEAAAASSDAVAAAPAQATSIGQALPAVVVYKTASCGCCNGWVDHLRDSGFEVDARDVVDIVSIKQDLGIVPAHSSCHTAVIDGYVVEGHVPADVMKRLLAERPQIAGLAVPGMPIGSPGMEGPNARPYDVLALDGNGGSTVYTTVDPR